MIDAEVGTVFAIALSLAGIWVIAFWLYRDYRVDRFRQEMFALRDELFDLASSGEISFEHPAYRMLRSMMNGYIRFGHRLNLSTVLIFGLWSRKEEREWLQERGFRARWREALVGTSEETKDCLNEFRRQAEQRVSLQLFFGSPILVATVVPVVVFYAIIKLHVELARRIQHHWSRSIGDQMDEAALALGECPA